MASCPMHGSCAFYRAVEPSLILRMKYASSYPYCKGGRHDTCAIAMRIAAGEFVADDLLPDGGTGDYRSASPTGPARVESGTEYVVVEDSPVFATIAANAIRQHFPGADVKVCTSYEEAVPVVRSGATKLIVSGYGVGGGKTVLDIRDHTSAPILVFTGRPGEDRELPSRCHVVTKGAGPDALHAAMDALVAG